MLAPLLLLLRRVVPYDSVGGLDLRRPASAASALGGGDVLPLPLLRCGVRLLGVLLGWHQVSADDSAAATADSSRPCSVITPLPVSTSKSSTCVPPTLMTT